MGATETAIEEGSGFLKELVKRNIGYCLFLGVVAAVIATGMTQFFLSGLSNFGQIVHPFVLIPEFFAIWLVISIVAFLATVRDEQIKRREEDVAKRESNLASRETELAKREMEDLLTPFRHALEGFWEMEFTRWVYDRAGKPTKEVDYDHAQFSINPDTGKLKIHVAIREG